MKVAMSASGGGDGLGTVADCFIMIVIAWVWAQETMPGTGVETTVIVKFATGEGAFVVGLVVQFSVRPSPRRRADTRSLQFIKDRPAPK